MGLSRRALAGGVGGAALLAAGFVTASSSISPLSATQTETVTGQEMGCDDWSGSFTAGECFAAGTIRYVALHNLQGAAQFCIWRKANPGEWLRLKDFAETRNQPQSIVTWFGGAIRNQLEAYFAVGAPAFSITPNTAPNTCRTPLPPPSIQNVTPGQTDVTITVGP